MPKYIFWMSLCLAFFSGMTGWAFGSGASHGENLSNNFIAMSGLFLCVFSVLSFFISMIFRWDWQSKHFGVFCVPFSTVSSFGIYPALCFYYYGTCPVYIRIVLLIANVVLILWWCCRFLLVYRKIMSLPEFSSLLYVEEDDANYYLQKNDIMILEKKLKFEQLPAGILLGGPMLLAVFLVPFYSVVSKYAGIPFPHIFLAIFAIPIELMCLGLVTRGILVFFYYPSIIARRTKKPVYVDLVSKK